MAEHHNHLPGYAPPHFDGRRWLTRPIAARLLGVTLARLDELAATGALRRFGGAQARFSREDVEHLLGRTLDDADFEFAADTHAPRLEAYKRANEKRAQERRRAAEPFNALPFADLAR